MVALPCGASCPLASVAVPLRSVLKPSVANSALSLSTSSIPGLCFLFSSSFSPSFLFSPLLSSPPDPYSFSSWPLSLHSSLHRVHRVRGNIDEFKPIVLLAQQKRKPLNSSAGHVIEMEGKNQLTDYCLK